MMKNKILYYVYELIDPRNNFPFYIGKGKEERMYLHVKKVKNNSLHNKNKKLQNKIKKILNSGFNDVIYNKIFESKSELDCYKKEIEKINEIGIKNLCNLTFGGEGLKPTTYVKNKISNTMKEKGISKGKNNPIYGTHRSKETKLKISSALKVPNSKFQKIIKSEEYRKNMSKSTIGNKNGMYGKKHSKETIEKIRNTKLGKKHSMETRMKMSESRKCRNVSLKTRIKIGNANTNPSENTRLKMSIARKLYWQNKANKEK